MYSLILFDADDTLFNYPSAEIQALKNTFLKYNPGNNWTYNGQTLMLEDWIDTYKRINHGLWEELERGRVIAEHLKVLRFTKLFEYYGLDVDAKDCSRSYLYYLSQGIELLDGAFEICSWIHEKYPIAIVTNGFKEVQHARIEMSPLNPFIDALFVSEEVGSSKPDSGIFQTAIDHFKMTDKSKILMIGDSLSADILGGIRFGVDTCWYNPKKKQNMLSNGDSLQMTYEISHLSELKKIIESHP